MLGQLGRIPTEGRSFDHEGWTLTVVAMDRFRIVTVRLVAP